MYSNVTGDKVLESRQVNREAAEADEVREFYAQPRGKLAGLSLSDIYEHGIPPASVQGLINQRVVMEELDELIRQKGKEGEKKREEDQDDEEEARQDAKADLVMQEYDPGAINQTQNKAIFRKNYGAEKELPTWYILDAKVCPGNSSQVLVVMKYIIPDAKQKVKMFDAMGQKAVVQTMKEHYAHEQFDRENVVLMLMQAEDKRLKVVHQVTVQQAYKVRIAFSQDGRYFAIFRRKLNNLQIYEHKSSNFHDLLQMVHQRKFLKEFAHYKPLRKAQLLQFDLNNKYLVAYGKQAVNLIDLDPDVSSRPQLAARRGARSPRAGASNPALATPDEHYSCDSLETRQLESRFERIYDIKFNSKGGKRCDVACKVKGLNVVEVFDLFATVEKK